jgi:hypothetical protein
MNSFFRILAAAAVLTSSAALAQIDVHVGLPSIRFEVVPRLVEVSAGVQVVEDYDEEVFLVDRHYYVRHGDRWYRSHDHRGHWVVVEHRHVPVTLVRAPRGKYRRYRHHPEHREVHVVRESPRRVVYVEDDHGHGKHKKHHGKGHGGKGHGGGKKHKD